MRSGDELRAVGSSPASYIRCLCRVMSPPQSSVLCGEGALALGWISIPDCGSSTFHQITLTAPRAADQQGEQVPTATAGPSTGSRATKAADASDRDRCRGFRKPRHRQTLPPPWISRPSRRQPRRIAGVPLACASRSLASSQRLRSSIPRASVGVRLRRSFSALSPILPIVRK
jgi:hypothetical protein